MKKILSLTLAVIMLLSVMPFSYMASAKVSVEAEECVYAYARMVSYGKSIYENWDSRPYIIEEIINEAIDEVETHCAGFEFYYEWLNDCKNAETINEATKIFKSASEKIEKLIETNDITVVIDTYEYFKYFQTIEIIYSKEEIDSISKAIENEKYAEMYEEAVRFCNEADERLAQCDFETQEDFDAVWKKACPIYDMIYNCLDGNHSYGEYVSNNDATYEADGTKTAECEFCGATVTVVDEGTKLQKEEDTVSFFEVIIALVIGFFEILFSIMA